MDNLVSYDPFSEFKELQRQLFNDNFLGHQKTFVAPITDIWNDDDKKLVVEVHLPNFDQKDIDINIEDNMLVIRAEKHEQEKSDNKNKQYVVRESSSSFYRRFSLPKIANIDAIKADMKDGVLTVDIPFKELPKPKKIAINAKK
jgi:HSP20 family protein